MRIKKKQIKEMTTDNAQEVADAAIDAKNDLENAGFEEPNAETIVTDLVSGDEEDTSISEADLVNDFDGQKGGPDYGEEPDANSTAINGMDTNDSSISESVNPRMTKNQLSEAVLGKKERKVINTFKVKNLRNE